MKLNEKLIRLRKQNGLTQDELASKLNVSRQTISKWKNGDSEPELNNIKQLIEIYNIDPDYLIYDECDELNKNKIIPLNNKLKFLILLNLLLIVITFIFLICLGFLPVWTHSSHLPTFFDSLIYYWVDPIFVI